MRRQARHEPGRRVPVSGSSVSPFLPVHLVRARSECPPDRNNPQNTSLPVSLTPCDISRTATERHESAVLDSLQRRPGDERHDVSGPDISNGDLQRAARRRRSSTACHRWSGRRTCHASRRNRQARAGHGLLRGVNNGASGEAASAGEARPERSLRGFVADADGLVDAGLHRGGGRRGFLEGLVEALHELHLRCGRGALAA